MGGFQHSLRQTPRRVDWVPPKALLSLQISTMILSKGAKNCSARVLTQWRAVLSSSQSESDPAYHQRFQHNPTSGKEKC